MFFVLNFKFFVAEVKMPSGKTDKPVIEDNRDGTVSINYGPREEGLHELHIKYNGEHVQGRDFDFSRALMLKHLPCKTEYFYIKTIFCKIIYSLFKNLVL